MTTKNRIATTLICLIGTLSTAHAQAAQSNTPDQAPYLDTSLSIEQCIHDLVSRMTVEEKASQVVHIAAAIPRLHVPAYNWWTEALHGVLTDNATMFPEPIGLASTFDAPRIHAMAIAIGTEVRAKHEKDIASGKYDGIGLDVWAPNVNIFRDPRWGRGQETYGEDPFLTARMGVAYVTGIQGDDARYLRVISTPKHFAVHSGPEPVRHTIDVKVSKHDEEDTYLPAFRAVVIEGKAGSVMCAYSSVNGEPACANQFLLEDQLRGHWKFDGYVVSDCDAVIDIYSGHHYSSSLAEAGAVSLKRGTDLDCNDPGNDASRYLEAIKKGLLTEDELTTAVKRLFTARFKLGMFDPPSMVRYALTPASEIESPEHRQLDLEIAWESMVLLKNDGTLPLKPGIKRIAVIGPLADQDHVLWGNYNGTPAHTVTALEGIRAEFKSARVTFVPGTTILCPPYAVPANVLTTPAGQSGLKAEYFANQDLGGPPLVTRIDRQLDFDFSGTSPAPGIGRDNFSVRWTGSITPDRTGPYELTFTGDDGYRVWLDGKLLFEDWSAYAPTTKTAEVQFEKGHAYSIRVEYFQLDGTAVANLYWLFRGHESPSETIEAARSADVVVAVVGISSELEGEEMNIDQPGFKGGDRTSLDLPAEEEELLETVKSSGKPLIVVLLNGSAQAINWADQNANAILDAWYPGELGGTAIAETLSGRNDPAGRLPVTFYKGIDQLPAFDDYSMKNRTYRYFTGTPLYTFGFGLSYTHFRYDDASVDADGSADGTVHVSAKVTNVGKVAGDEVAQLYISHPNVEGAPIRALCGFERIHLDSGESRVVHFAVGERELSLVDSDGVRRLLPGEVDFWIGGGQPVAGARVPAGAGAETKTSLSHTAVIPE